MDQRESVDRKIKYSCEEVINTWSKASGRNAEEALDLSIFLKYNLVSFGAWLEMGEEIKEDSKMTSNGDITHQPSLTYSTQQASHKLHLEGDTSSTS